MFIIIPYDFLGINFFNRIENRYQVQGIDLVSILDSAHWSATQGKSWVPGCVSEEQVKKEVVCSVNVCAVSFIHVCQRRASRVLCHAS